MRKTMAFFLLVIVLFSFPKLSAQHRIMLETKQNTVSTARMKVLALPFPSRTQIISHHEDSVLLYTFSNQLSLDSILKAYKTCAAFTQVEPDYKGEAAGHPYQTPDDQVFSKQWYLNNDGSSSASARAGADINISPAWKITTGKENITVAILDSGIDPDNPDFHGRLWENKNEIPGNGIDDDNNGYIDDDRGWNFVSSNNLPWDDQGHGTAVAGLLAATGNNRYGMAGVDWHCKLMICKTLDSNLEGYYSQWIEAIYYAVDHGADIINFSMIGRQPSGLLEEAIKYASSRGVMVVASMGNDNNETPCYPAAYPTTLAVGATDEQDHRKDAGTKGSNFGQHIDVMAPGNNMYSYGQEKLWSGTSMSAPLVSGIAALIKGGRPNLNDKEIKAIIIQGSEDQVGDLSEDKPGWDRYYGWGRVNAYNSLVLLQNLRSWTMEGVLNIFPNPSKGIIHVNYKSREQQDLQLSIVDAKGKLHHKANLKFNQKNEISLSLDLSTFSPGIYYLIIQENERKLSRVVVID
ncbi:S8 family serine peptidase [Fulvivirga sediminis]|uniref:S8 family serine peptidase n=1 Tax=Fulvivirga sediminis TaxID=2803949 RepID=A0A937FCZ3_9BACT|nr:S8 family serine peptidase [Fulvivirga sediminis]MBL3658934.1 S8 family serine peptidase [Fulvivirga sediminis]